MEMKIYSKYILMLASAAAFATACEVAQIETPEPDVTPVVLAENEMAARLPKFLDLSWAKGDKITVITSSASQEFEILDDYTRSLAKFSGETIDSESYSILYSAAGNTVAAAESRSYEGQEQAVSGASDHLNFDILLSGVSSYKDVTFSKEWAEENGGEFKMSNCIMFDLKFPGQVLTLKNIGLKANRALFFSTNAASSATDSLSLAVPGVDISLKENEFTAYMAASWQPLNITEQDQITLWAQYGEKAYRAVLPAQNITLDGGEILEITVSADAWEYYDMNPGSKINPHQIKTAADLKAMASQLIDGEDRYFELMADIDMAGEECTPINTDDSKYRGMIFEGNGHKISNLTVNSDSDFASFAGVLMGSMKNVTFENPSVTSNYDTVGSVGVIAAYAGYANGDAKVVMENINVTGAAINVTKSHATPAGIIAGQAKNVTITNCHVKGNVLHTGAVAECNVGGFIGKLDGGSLSDCSFEGNVELTTDQTRVVGGFLGSIRSTSTVKNCSQKGNLSTPAKVRYASLFVGHIAAKQTLLQNCSAEGNLVNVYENSGVFCGTVAKNVPGVVFDNCDTKFSITPISGGNNLGGLIGAVESADIVIKNCDTRGDIRVTAKHGNVAGILGYGSANSANLLIEKCSYDGYMGNASHNQSFYSGIVGDVRGAGTTVRNCWSAGEIAGANLSSAGICGGTRKNSVIECCYSTMTITAGHAVGGILGRADDNSDSQESNAALGNVVRKCIAWNPLIKSRKLPLNPAKNHSCAAVVGKTAGCNTMEDCYRRADMKFDVYGEVDFEVLFDQENSNETTPLVWNNDAKYYWPYNGKAAAADATVSSVAKSLGWDESVWDLSGDLPVLK